MEIWCHDFEGISWENVGYTTSGMAGVYSDNFTSINHVDLLGTGPGGSQSFLTAPIFGDVSNNSTSYGSRGCGGCWMNVYDYDDGLEDILYNHHDLICILKGTDDTRLLNKYVGDMFGGWTANGHTYVADFRANGQWVM